MWGGWHFQILMGLYPKHLDTFQILIGLYLKPLDTSVKDFIDNITKYREYRTRFFLRITSSDLNVVSSFAGHRITEEPIQ